MNRYQFLDVDVTCLEGLSSKPSFHSLFKTSFYAVVSATTPASICSRETPLAKPLGNKTHAWKNSPPLRFSADTSKFHDDCSMLMIQLRSRRRYRVDEDVGEPLIVPIFDLFESAENEGASRSNSAVYGVDLNDNISGKEKKKQVYLYFSYKFSNSSVIRVSAGGEEDVSAAAWRSDTKVVRKYRDTNGHFYPLEGINNAVYQLLLFRYCDKSIYC